MMSTEVTSRSYVVRGFKNRVRGPAHDHATNFAQAKGVLQRAQKDLLSTLLVHAKRHGTFYPHGLDRLCHIANSFSIPLLLYPPSFPPTDHSSGASSCSSFSAPALLLAFRLLRPPPTSPARSCRRRRRPGVPTALWAWWPWPVGTLVRTRQTPCGGC